MEAGSSVNMEDLPGVVNPRTAGGAPLGGSYSKLEEGSNEVPRRTASGSQRLSGSSRLSGSRRLSGTRRSSQRHDESQRVVYINNPDRTNKSFNMAGNVVRTSKYTLLSFLPKNLFEQFHRFAYIYFLFIVILNQIPQLAVFGRTASLFPLVLVLVVTAVKDGYEDFGRRRSDKRENNRTSLVLHEGKYQDKKWKKIRVGEMVKILANETVPCDVVLLATSDPSGVCYVETLNLDGESNLKSRYARSESTSEHPEERPLKGTIVCELPNRNIYEFQAYMDLGTGPIIPLAANNIILRGCELKNTSWVVGVVVYAGRETKAMLNSAGAQSKRSRLEQFMNRETGWLAIFLIIICFIGGLGMGLWVNSNRDILASLPYYKKEDLAGQSYRFYGSWGEGAIGFLSCIIRFQIMIPLSLYISMELVRLGQSYFMTNDAEMYHKESNSKFQCRALNINEDLGQVKYLFSDKTGTLTENKMDFDSASIGGVDYSKRKVSVDPAAVTPDNSIRSEDTDVLEDVKVNPELVHLLASSTPSAARDLVFEYFLVLAACNTVVPTRVKKSASGQLEMEAVNSNEESAGHIEYQGESPDEQALVAAAAAYGFTLLERTSASIVINVCGDRQRYEVLGIHEFDSVRKRMSVIVECPDKSIKILVKGADSSVLNIVADTEDGNLRRGSEVTGETQRSAEILSATLEHLDRYAREGLRTLVVASKGLSQKEVEDWHFHYVKASSALNDRIGMLRNAAELVENNLKLLGATGIEDKLQVGVPEIIQSLREAGIRVWVLTGDKQETAISIGFSCLLLTRDMQQIIINENTFEGCRSKIVEAKSRYGIKSPPKKKWFSWKGQNSIDAAERDGNPYSNRSTGELSDDTRFSQSLALIIDGNSLVHALQPALEKDFYELATTCKVVVCCRVAPLQKAGVVSLVKRRSGEMTLAVGDGANDVSMIQMADVGVGISGQEGRQAVMASDYAIGQFRFLKKLLLVHGHWNYERLGYMVLYNFYRNAVFVMMLFWFIFYAAFSAQSALTDWNLVFFSLLYTSVPTIVVGILDKDVSQKTLYEYPPLYGSGQRDEAYNQRLFWVTMLDTLWQSLVLFYVPYFIYKVTDVDLYGLGLVWTMAVVILVNLHLAMDIQQWTWIEHVAIWASTLVTYLCQLVMDAMSSAPDLLPNHWVVFHMSATWRFWFTLLLTVIIALLPKFCVKLLKTWFWPSDLYIAREAEILDRHNQEVRNLELREVLDQTGSNSMSNPPPTAI
ncbi:hypothetical protein KC19_5G097600 [Ceratodon purpureus]|uniref:Phospholipid-transporting ATPase n=1 Tax=Ceratodon purpureus TaxID=3225 RepID=A0A8T0I168_CERPU|nr:hypothetical protein KC19_5G097600 [Ceratodon purpureus]